VTEKRDQGIVFNGSVKKGIVTVFILTFAFFGAGATRRQALAGERHRADAHPSGYPDNPRLNP